MIILASKSPRRSQLLKELIDEFEVIPSLIDENGLPLDKLSLLKAQEIAKNHSHDLIIAADTVVMLDNQAIGKPKDNEDAKRILNILSSRKHQVITYYTILCEDPKMQITKKVVTDVYFNSLSQSLIDEYVATGLPLDKAGAYGIQDGFNLIAKFEGSYTNVVGLPLEELKEDLLKIGIRLKNA